MQVKTLLPLGKKEKPARITSGLYTAATTTNHNPNLIFASSAETMRRLQPEINRADVGDFLCFERR